MSWIPLFSTSKLVKNAGVCAKYEEQQIAIFCVQQAQETQVYALHNWDPIGEANVLSRGILGSLGESLVVASPLYKQHFCLETGKCLEQDEVYVPVYQVRCNQGNVELLVE
jgi:nitrite reductase (NADH) small subunit